MANISESVTTALRLHQQGKLQEAERIYRKVLDVEPNHADALHFLGMIASQNGHPEVAVDYMNRSIASNANMPAFYVNLGKVLRQLGKLDDAVACYQRALLLMPNSVETHYNLGNALQEQGKLEDAVVSYRRAIQLKPDYVEAHNNLGHGLKDQGKLDGAIASYRRALELNPDDPDTYNKLGNALKDQGILDGALACFRRALEIKPDHFMVHSNLLHTLVYSLEDEQSIYDEHRHWNERHALPLSRFIHHHLNEPDPERRIRIGYVSPDFRNHPVGRFILPLLKAHDHEQLEIVCYSDVKKPDSITDEFRAHADLWRDVSRLSNEQLADTIRDDRIDILVDLAMHTANNRLLLFARKPAPVQVTYLGYPGTTGLTSIDYRLTDPYLDPPGHDDRFYSEQSIRLPETFWCYPPPDEAPPVNDLPALEKKYVTFGCLNNYCKINPKTLEAWIVILEAVPESRLLLLARPGTHRDKAWATLAQHGIPTERLEFVDFLPSSKYFECHHRIDVALDPFPYGGHTTTCDALWMGVPVVTLAGRRAVGRGALSILSNVGLTDLVAQDLEQYVQIAADLANDLQRLSDLRMGMRERMRASPLMDAPRFARNVEAAYREMWRRWCTK